MFFVKTKIGNVTISAEVTGENVFTVCPDCQREHEVDLQEILSIWDWDTNVYCDQCTKIREMREDKQKAKEESELF